MGSKVCQDGVAGRGSRVASRRSLKEDEEEWC